MYHILSHSNVVKLSTVHQIYLQLVLQKVKRSPNETDDFPCYSQRDSIHYEKCFKSILVFLLAAGVVC